MTSDRDIYRSAKQLVDEHGTDAPIHAAMMADEFMERGNMEACAVWKRIIRACDELLAAERPEGAVVH